MKPPPVLHNEEMRLQRLDQLRLLDTQAESVLDAFTQLLAAMTGLPIALISLVGRYHEWWKSAVGLPQGGRLPRELSFCAHAIGAREAFFEVEDARCDARFADNPVVLNAPHVVHYAAAPLQMPQGERIGTLAVVGSEPGRLGAQARTLMTGLARIVVEVLLLRERQQQFDALAQAQQSLRESEARLRTMADAMPQMLWSTRPDGQVDYYNQRWHEYVGTPPGSGLGHAWMAPVHPQDRAQVAWQWSRSLASGAPYEIECRLRHHSGEYRWILARALPVRDEAGAVLRWLGTCTDIERQKHAEERLRAADQRKDDFLAMLAHELRSPLAPIVMAAHTLAMVPEDTARVRTAAEVIGRQVRHMSALLGDLMDISRVTRGTIRLQRRQVDLKAVVHDALEQAWPTLDERGHKVSLHQQTRPLPVEGDRTRLIQVVANLLNNAARYTPPGGRISLNLAQEGDMAHISVEDNGVGIEPEMLPLVFDLFIQGGRTAQRGEAGGGLGLGLALVKSLVELHGGTVRAHSEGPGRGSRFCIWLPLAPAARTPSGAQPGAPGRTQRGLHIMVVDDNVDTAHSLGTWLEAQGHHVRVETDPRRALEHSATHPAQVYMLDIGLPHIDGYELARRLREQPGARGAVLVALTGYGQPRDVARARQAGFDHHIVKPLDPQRMAQVLAEAG